MAIVDKRRLGWGLLTLGLVLRFVWAMARGLSRDDLTSLSYVFDPSWMSATWDNSPPTFYVVMKAIALAGAGEMIVRFVAFAISALTFVLFFRHLEKEEESLWPLAFWAVYPTSVINATFRPTILAELSGVLFYLALKSGALGRLAGAVLALVASTYLAFIAPLVALADVDFKNRRTAIFLALSVLIACFGVLFIRWQSLSWLGSSNLIELVKSSFLMLSQLWGFSLPLFFIVTWLLWRNRQMPRSVLVIIFLVLAGPLVTGHQFMSSRFLISISPWVVASVMIAMRIRTDWPARALMVLIPAVTTIWFLIHEKSGWVDAGSYVTKSGGDAIFYAPPTMTRSFSPRFKTGDGNLQSAIRSQLPDGGWIVRANPDRDEGMNEFLKSDSKEFVVEEVRVFGGRSLEPVRAVRVRANH